MTKNIFLDFLANYLKKVESILLTTGVIEKSNSGIIRGISDPYGYVSFYPQEIDFIVSIAGGPELFSISLETMNQEGGGVEDVWDFQGHLPQALEKLELDLEKIILSVSKVLDLKKG